MLQNAPKHDFGIDQIFRATEADHTDLRFVWQLRFQVGRAGHRRRSYLESKRRGVGLRRGPGVGLAVRNLPRRVGVGLGFGLGKSCGRTGSARRTSGSAALGCGTGEGAVTAGCGSGVVAIAGVGLAALSTGEARGATIVSAETVAVGEAPMTG
jgi:hypothetical protein